MDPLITNIQRFCVHDGPGIRTTVFFKGCSLHCPWCANPENIKKEKQFYYMAERCVEACSRREECNARQGGKELEADLEKCPYGAVGIFGQYYTQEQLLAEILKDSAFFQDGGGVTFSGGECLLFLKEYDRLLEKLHQAGVSVCIETALFVSQDILEWAVCRADYFYVDIKSLEPEVCRKTLGGNLERFLNNLEYLHARVPGEKIVYRVPLAEGVTLTDSNIMEIGRLICRFPPEHVEIFGVHNLGEKKYERLGENYKRYHTIETERLNQVKNYFSQMGIKCTVNLL